MFVLPVFGVVGTDLFVNCIDTASLCGVVL